MSDVFLSHNSADKPAVESLAHCLRAEGIEPWLDNWNLIPGNPWQEEIEQALNKCRSCAMFIGPSGIGPWQNAEMRAAIDRRIGKGGFRVVPVLLPGASRGKESHLPAFLTATTWVEFRDMLDDDEQFRRLICGIRGIEPGPRVLPKRLLTANAPIVACKCSMWSTRRCSSVAARVPIGYWTPFALAHPRLNPAASSPS